MSEKRKHFRSEISVPFEVSHDSFGSITVNSRDISVGGIFAVGNADIEAPPEGTILEVNVHGGNIQAEVVRIEGDGFGLRFLGTGDEE